ncbi:4655_t:CDS:2, partial [Funneliformis caledonium]
LLVVTVPAEITEEAKAIMRLCLMDANFIDRPGTQKLQFISEPEAAAIHCMKLFREQFTNKTKSTYMVVDCGG